jgi:hypothetical protein
MSATREKLLLNIELASLDISQDPSEQGFKRTDYDLIVLPIAPPETKKLQENLANIKKLLSPDIRMLLQTLSPSSK